jgi:hypothetical protein
MLLLAGVTLVGCSYFKDVPPEPWDGKVYTGDGDRGGLYRAQDGGELVKPGEEKFNAMVCLTADDFKKLIGSYRYFRSKQCDVK